MELTTKAALVITDRVEMAYGTLPMEILSQASTSKL
jgi:hypothetical protein